MSKVIYITAEGLQKLKDEINHLETVVRPAISKQIGEAIDKGDLSENAEYDAAKEQQGLTEMKISQLKTTLAFSRIIDESKIDTSSVQMLNTVKLKNVKNNATMEYTIVSAREANVREKKISVDTPIAKGLIGKKVGDIVEIDIPAGKIELEVLSIRY